MRQRFGVVVTPSKDVSLMLKGIQASFGYQGVASIEPHLTLVPPFNLDLRELSKMLTTLGRVGSSVQPFEVELCSWRSFNSNGDVLYLEVSKGVPELEEIQQLLMGTGLFREVERKFVPHLTIAIGIGSERTLQAQQILDSVHFSFDVDSLEVLTKLPDERWKRCARFVLGWGSQKNISHLRVGLYLEAGVSQGVLEAIDVQGTCSPFIKVRLHQIVSGTSDGLCSLVMYVESEIVGVVIFRHLMTKLAIVECVVIFDVNNRGFGLGRLAMSSALEVLRYRHTSYVLAKSVPQSLWLKSMGFLSREDFPSLDVLSKLAEDDEGEYLVRVLY